jgi:coenzyme PQQ precursor peptide PqqA
LMQPMRSILTIRLGKGKTMWTTPVVREIAVGLEINCYACADL